MWLIKKGTAGMTSAINTGKTGAGAEWSILEICLIEEAMIISVQSEEWSLLNTSEVAVMLMSQW